MTEGVLRALHRAEAPLPPFERWTWPYHDFTRPRASRLPPGRPDRIRVGMLPTSWRFRAGNRIRLSISCADADHFAQVPHGRPPLLTIFHGGVHTSQLDLPWRGYEEI